MLSYRDALDRILDVTWEPPKETVPLMQAPGRVLAAPIRAPWPLPRHDQSAMDGFAHHAAEAPGASLRVVGESAAGQPHAGPVAAGEAIRISTGAHLPPGLDAVTPREAAQFDAETGRVVIESAARPGRFIRWQGGHVAAGAIVAAPGMIVTPAVLALLAAYNLPEVEVYARPRVAILTSGNEIKPHGAALGPADIVGSSLYYLEQELRACGCEPRVVGIAPDDRAAFIAMMDQSLEWADLIVTTAGVSVGDHDVVRAALHDLDGHVHFWRVAVRPGKPMLLAEVRGVPWFGLPGNPVSTCCNTEIFIKPFLRQGFAMDPAELPPEKLPLLTECGRDTERLFFPYGSIQIQEGRRGVTPLPNQDSGNLLLPAAANALLIVQPGPAPIPHGECVDVIPVRAGL